MGETAAQIDQELATHLMAFIYETGRMAEFIEWHRKQLQPIDEMLSKWKRSETTNGRCGDAFHLVCKMRIGDGVCRTCGERAP